MKQFCHVSSPSGEQSAVLHAHACPKFHDADAVFRGYFRKVNFQDAIHTFIQTPFAVTALYSMAAFTISNVMVSMQRIRRHHCVS